MAGFSRGYVRIGPHSGGPAAVARPSVESVSLALRGELIMRNGVVKGVAVGAGLPSGPFAKVESSSPWSVLERLARSARTALGW